MIKLDGRNIDTRLGTLTGEAADQHIETDEKALTAPSFPKQPSEQSAWLTGDATYYDRPVVKKSVWSWDIPAYYYVGGVTGVSAAFGAAATLLSRREMASLIGKSRWIGVTGATISSVLLIHDLGRPARFHHMLRVFRPTSPMNIGTYILITFSSFAGLSAMLEFAPRSFRWIADASAVIAGIFGLGLAGYTGVLVANTSIPVWQRPHRQLPPLFLSSATASAASLFEILGVSEAEHSAVTVFGAAGAISELTFATLLEREVSSVTEAARPLKEGFSGTLWKTGKALSAASLVLSLVPGASPWKRRVTGLLGTAGALCIRFGIHYAGQRSAMNPRATFHQQRQGQGAYPFTGKSAVVGPNDLRSFA